MTAYQRSNIIFYCKKWQKTLDFYQSILELSVHFSNVWFTEFKLCANSYLSIVNQDFSTIKASQLKETTLSLEVYDLKLIHKKLSLKNAKPSAIKNHSWGAKVFYLYDPEGRRIELWQH